MGKYILIVVTVLALETPTLADCRGTKWTHSRSLSVPQIKMTLDKMRRKQVLDTLLFELHKAPRLHVATPILSYLIQTEGDSLNRGFFKTLGVVSFGEKVDVISDLDKWPKRRPVKKSQKNSREICRLVTAYEKANNSNAKKSK